MTLHRLVTVTCVLALSAVLVAGSPPAVAGALRAGAAKVDITPAENMPLPMAGYGGRARSRASWEGVHDPLYVRAIVVDDGEREAAIVIVDLVSVARSFVVAVSARITEKTGIPAERILIAATHTHAAPLLAYHVEDPDEHMIAYTALLADRMIQAVTEARANKVPALVGAGTGTANVNVNRRARQANGGWGLGRNPDGPSDKTVGVVKFARTDGSPIAILVNYGVHGTVMGGKNMILSGDLPGATAHYVEQHYGGDVVSPWTSGTAGDQNPIYSIESTFGGRIDPVITLGNILGEEVVRVADNIRLVSTGRVRGRQRTILVPGKQGDPIFDTGSQDGPARFNPGPSVEVTLSLLMIRHIALTGVSGEVLTPIGLRMKETSPFTHTFMITHCNGRSGYLPHADAYDQVSYEIRVTRVRRGADHAILTGLQNLLERID